MNNSATPNRDPSSSGMPSAGRSFSAPRRNRRRRRRGSAGGARSISGQILGLSLFVMLLAFFIVLNAISSVEDTKVRPVVNSLSTTFSAHLAVPDTEDLPSAAPDKAVSVGEGSALERVKALFAAQIPGGDAVLNKRRGVMYMRVPFADLESAVMAAGRGGAPLQPAPDASGGTFLRGFFLPALVALLKTDEAATPYRMDMILNVADNPGLLWNEQPQQARAATRRMARIAQKIQDAGLPARLISAGMQKGPADTVDLVFRRHVPFNPLGESRHER